MYIIRHFKMLKSVASALLLGANFATPKLFATLTPVVRPDAHSTCLQTAQDGPALAKYLEATAYLKQVPHAAQILEQLEKSPTDYKIEIVDRTQPGFSAGANEFDGARNLVRWDPDTALGWRGAFFSLHAHSAAIGLMHELGHAYHKDMDPDAYFRRAQSKTFDRWGTLEEKRTIQAIENPIAKALGESERNFHEDSQFFACGSYAAVTPTSSQPAQKHATFGPVPMRRRLSRFLTEKLEEAERLALELAPLSNE